MGTTEQKGYNLIIEGTSGYIVHALVQYGYPKPIDIFWQLVEMNVSGGTEFVDIYKVIASYN